MKCGEICARSARTSASTNRRRDASSSARSSWPDTQAATSSVARTSPAVGYGVPTTTCPTTSSSTTSGLRMTCCTGQLTRWHPSSDWPAILVDSVVWASAATWSSWWPPRPSQASTRSVSVNATAGAPSSARRCRMLRSALASVSPSRSAGPASDASCSVRNVARSASVPRWDLRNTLPHD